MGQQEAMFGAGCFWGVEQRFLEIPGVLSTAVGYAGGRTEHPTYQEVCSDTTGHAEVVHLEYDDDRVSYEALLEAFFAMHNPTQLNRQGVDVGSQYRSVIFTYGDAQHASATAAREAADASGRWEGPVVTQVEAAPTFWKGEAYHQKYLQKHGRAACPTHLSS